VKRARNNLLKGPSYDPFFPKFYCHGNGGQSGVNTNNTVKLANPKTIPWNQKLRLYLIHSRSYDGLKHCLIFPIGAIVIFHIFVKNRSKCWILKI